MFDDRRRGSSSPSNGTGCEHSSHDHGSPRRRSIGLPFEPLRPAIRPRTNIFPAARASELCVSHSNADSPRGVSRPGAACGYEYAMVAVALPDVHSEMPIAVVFLKWCNEYSHFLLPGIGSERAV